MEPYTVIKRRGSNYNTPNPMKRFSIDSEPPKFVYVFFRHLGEDGFCEDDFAVNYGQAKRMAKKYAKRAKSLASDKSRPWRKRWHMKRVNGARYWKELKEEYQSN